MLISSHPLAHEALNGLGTLHLLNTTIIPWRDGLDFTNEGTNIPVADAVAIHSKYAEKAAVVSHIGHESTASALTTLLGAPVAYGRASWNGEGIALIFQLKQRGEEGKVYSAAELATMGAGFRLMRINWTQA